MCCEISQNRHAVTSRVVTLKFLLPFAHLFVSFPKEKQHRFRSLAIDSIYFHYVLLVVVIVKEIYNSWKIQIYIMSQQMQQSFIHFLQSGFIDSNLRLPSVGHHNCPTEAIISKKFKLSQLKTHTTNKINNYRISLKKKEKTLKSHREFLCPNFCRK